MFNFIYGMWVMRKINELKVAEYVVKGYITQVEADLILATPQMAV